LTDVKLGIYPGKFIYLVIYHFPGYISQETNTKKKLLPINILFYHVIVTGPALREFSNEEMRVLFNSINKKKQLIQKLQK
jgi:hypothetical protein